MGADVLEASSVLEREAVAAASAAAAATAAAVKGKQAVAVKVTGQVVSGAAKKGFSLSAAVQSWPKPTKHLLAGAFSGGVSKTATAPLEAVRIKLMVGQGSSIGEVISNISKTSGLRGFFNGNFADVLRTAPQKSVQLASFDLYKKLLMKVDPETGKKALPTWGAPLAGSLAGVTSTVTCFPLEVLRTRLAVSTEYKSMLDAVVKITAKEGPKAFFGGLGPSVVGVIPYAGCNLGMYDGLRWLYQTTTGNEKVPNYVSLCIGSVAGVSAATATFPLEVVRRRMMMGQKYAGTLQAIMEISRKEGPQSLFKGCMLNWVKLAPSAGLSFYFYEMAKDGLGLSSQ